MPHAAKRITDENGVTYAYEYRNTIIEGDWSISGFGPEFATQHPSFAAAKAYVDRVVDGVPCTDAGGAVMHEHECRDCGATIPAGAACTPLPTNPDDCDWPGGNAGCTC